MPAKSRQTPTILYTWAAAIALMLAVAAALSFLAVQTMESTSSRIENNTGPVLISTQGLVASLAEADAANTAVFLSGIDGGDEDVSQRRLYESAIARAPQQIEDISAGIGDDTATHDALKDVAQQLVEYAGVVEQARLSNTNGLAGADDLLSASLELTGGSNGMLVNADEVTERTQQQFNDDLSAGRILLTLALVSLVLSLALLFVAQMRLRYLTKRLINFGLAAATLAVVSLTIWLLLAGFGRTIDLDTARDEGFGDIALSAQLQTAAFDYKTRETGAIIRERGEELPDPAVLDEIDATFAQLVAASDSDRESALITELSTRWERYLQISGVISARVAQGNFDEARDEVGGEGNQTFNGFNTTLEALNLTNQEQFNASVASAAARLRWLSFATILLPLFAAAFAWLGYRPRINEYF